MKTTFFTIVLVCLRIALFGQDYNPFESIGKPGKILTLSNGRYIEIHTNDSLQKIGSVIVNMKTGKIHKLINTDTIYSEEVINPTIINRFYSIDPSWRRYPGQSPYSAFNNTPTVFADPTGKSGIFTIEQGKNGQRGTITINADIFFYGTKSSGELARIQTEYIREMFTSNITEMMVNGEIYKVSWEIDGNHYTYSEAWKIANDIDYDAGSIPNGLAEVDHGIDEMNNFIRIEEFNQAAENKNSGLGAISQMGTSDDKGSNSGFWILNGITSDKTEGTHELLHGFFLDHSDSDFSGNSPDGMTAAETPASKYPNMKREFIDSKNNVISIGNATPTVRLLMLAFTNNGYKVDPEKGLMVNFDANGKFVGTLGKANNRMYDQNGNTQNTFDPNDPSRDK